MLVAAVGAISTAFVSLTLHERGVSEPEPGTCARNRTLHLIRHAEGWHNVDEIEAEAAFKAGARTWHGIDLRDPENVRLRSKYGIAWTLLERVTGRKYHDPHLTPKGREQSYELRRSLRAEPTFTVDAVALSPMRRTIETALLGLPQLEAAATAFAWQHDDDPPTPPPMVATDLLRERCAHFMPDSRLPRSELQAQFGGLGGRAAIDFGSVDEDDTPFLNGHERHEPEVGSPLLAQRAEAALRWLASLPATYAAVAVVSHKHFLGAITGVHAETVAQRPFANAERRTVLLCDGGGADGGGADGATVKPVRARVKPYGAAT